MFFVSTQQLRGFVLLTLFATSVSATPAATPEIFSYSLKLWSETNFKPAEQVVQKFEAGFESNAGHCYDLPPNVFRSAKAMNGYKCTIYSDKGCHGWRTNEFNQDGIADMGSKMNVNGEAWRCCKIGTTNYWGYCDAKLNPGTQ